MGNFKVVLEFNYSSDESIEHWNIDQQGFNYVDTPDRAIQTAIAELEANGPTNFTFEVYDEDGEFIKSN